MPRKPINNNETTPTEPTPVETGAEQSHTARNIILGTIAVGAVAGGLFWNANRDRELITPQPTPTPTVEVTATPRISPSPEAVEPYPTLGPDEYMTKGGLIMKIATPSASPRK
jgi:hypothetical protein